MNRSTYVRIPKSPLGPLWIVIAILHFPLDARSEPESSVDELHSEIDRLLKLDATEPEEARTAAFERIEELAGRLAEVGDFETAGALARKGATLFPDERRSLTLWGWVEGLSGNYERAIEVTRSALEAEADLLPDKNNESLLNAEMNLGGFLIHVGELQEAVKVLERRAQRGNDPGAVQYLLGQAYFELGESFLSAKSYEQAFKSAEKLATPEDYFRYATVLDRMNKLDRAEKALQAGARNLPNASGLYLNLGLNAEARGATREAYLHYGMETEVSGPASPFSEAALKRIDRIETIQSKSQFPDAPLQSLIAYSKLLREKSKPENADPEIDAKIDSAFNAVFAHTWASHPYLKLLQAEYRSSVEAPNEAIRTLEGGLAEYPNQVLFTLELATVYGEIGDASKSDALIRDALLAAPDHWKAQQIVGPMGHRTEPKP